jgi:hypothetical protein
VLVMAMSPLRRDVSQHVARDERSRAGGHYSGGLTEYGARADMRFFYSKAKWDAARAAQLRAVELAPRPLLETLFSRAQPGARSTTPTCNKHNTQHQESPHTRRIFFFFRESHIFIRPGARIAHWRTPPRANTSKSPHKHGCMAYTSNTHRAQTVALMSACDPPPFP